MDEKTVQWEEIISGATGTVQVEEHGRTISAFAGRYRFLSNFIGVGVTLDGLKYPSVEAAFQAAKTLDPQRRTPFRSAGPRTLREWAGTSRSALTGKT